MKTILAALAGLTAALALTAPASAENGWFDAPVPYVQARDHGWGGGGDWRDRGDWQQRPGRWDEDDDALTERQIARRVMREGFVRIVDIDRRRDRYIVTAVRPNGALVRLALDAYDGEVIARERIGWAAGDRGPDRFDRRPANGITFDLGSGTLGIYSR
ncbi:hypothetical protein [Aureimonas endophytica]|nr:hypothetical protein [Aureimonas endophytica]